MKSVLKFFDILLLRIKQLDLLHPPCDALVFIHHHTDLRLNQLSYMLLLGNSSIESSVLKNIKVDVFLVHFPFFARIMRKSLYLSLIHI